jgi:hypothetical protein
MARDSLFDLLISALARDRVTRTHTGERRQREYDCATRRELQLVRGSVATAHRVGPDYVTGDLRAPS